MLQRLQRGLGQSVVHFCWKVASIYLWQRDKYFQVNEMLQYLYNHYDLKPKMLKHEIVAYWKKHRLHAIVFKEIIDLLIFSSPEPKAPGELIV